MRPISITVMFFAAMLALPGLSSCGDRTPSGPPDTKLGHDMCATCDMTVNEDRYSAGAVILRDGAPSHASFDDIGCMLDFEREHPEIHCEKRFVRDALSGEWITAEKAFYAIGEHIHTPMASGIAAYSVKSAAEARQGTVLMWKELPEVRKQFMEARYGKPK